MLRGCLFSLALYAILAAAYFVWLDAVFERPESYVGAGVAALLVLGCVGALVNSAAALRTWSLASSAVRGAPPRDGRLTAIAGSIHPVGAPLRAPFSGEACVVCEYDLTSAERLAGAEDRSNAGSDFAGFLMNPCVLRSRAGEVRLLGYPLLEGFDEDWRPTYTAALNARQFLSSTQFEDRSGVKILTVLSVFEDVWADDDGMVQKNMRLSQIDPRSLFPPESEAELIRLAKQEADEGAVHVGDAADDEDEDEDDDFLRHDSRPALPKMTEKRVAVGEEVCAIGIYDERRRGLLPRSRGRQPNRLIRGAPDEIIRSSRASFVRNLVGGLIALIVIHAALYGVMQAYLRSEETARSSFDSSTGRANSRATQDNEPSSPRVLRLRD